MGFTVSIQPLRAGVLATTEGGGGISEEFEIAENIQRRFIKEAIDRGEITIQQIEENVLAQARKMANEASQKSLRKAKEVLGDIINNEDTPELYK